MVHFLLERGANLNLTARCSAPAASSTSTVLAVARSATSYKSHDIPEGKIKKPLFCHTKLGCLMGHLFNHVH